VEERLDMTKKGSMLSDQRRRSRRGAAEPITGRRGEMIRAGIVGLGWWGRTLNERLRSSRSITVTHGVDTDLARLEGVPGLQNLVLSDDYDRLLSTDQIDAVIIATPHAL